MYSQANVRALPSVILDTEKVLRGSGWVCEAGRGETAPGWKGVRSGVRLKNRTVRARSSRKNTSAMLGNFIYRHHVEPRVKLYSPREESFPVPLKYIDVSRTIHTNLDVKQERRIDDYWNIDGSRDLSDPWDRFHTIYFIGRKTS